MFPIDERTIEQAQQAASKMVPVQEVGRSIKFDYEKRAFVFTNGKAEEVTQEEAVKQWLELMCRTLPERYPVYFETGFGIETDKIVGYKALPKGFIYSEIQRQIKENVVLSRCISNIINFSAVAENGRLNIYFTAILYTGEEVTVDVNV